MTHTTEKGKFGFSEKLSDQDVLNVLETSMPKTSAYIGKELGIDKRTVQKHLNRLENDRRVMKFEIDGGRNVAWIPVSIQDDIPPEEYFHEKLTKFRRIKPYVDILPVTLKDFDTVKLVVVDGNIKVSIHRADTEEKLGYALLPHQLWDGIDDVNL